MLKNIFNFIWKNNNIKIDYLYETVFGDIEDIKFGIEIEFQALDKTINGDYIINILKNNGILVDIKIIKDRHEKKKYLFWQVMKESTCDWELISPIFEDKNSCWKQIEKVCNVLKEQLQATVDDKTAIHVHIQRKPLLSNGNYYISLMNLYRYLEPFTYAFSAGEYSEVSSLRVKEYATTLDFADKNFWAKGICQDEAKYIIKHDDYNLIDSYYAKRVVGLNFSTAGTNCKTVEFRTFNGTLNPIMIQSYLIYVINMIDIARQNDFKEKYDGKIFKSKQGKIVLSKTYVNKCISILANNEMQRNRFLQPLIRNNYYISQTLHNALSREEI